MDFEGHMWQKKKLDVKLLMRKARNSRLDELLSKIRKEKNENNRRVLYNELLDRADTILSNDECLDVVEQHLSLIVWVHVLPMVGFEMIHSSNENEAAVRSRVRQLILKAVDLLPQEDTVILIQQLIDYYGTTFNRYEPSCYGDRVQHYINEIANDEHVNPMPLIFLSPSAFYAKIAIAMRPAELVDERQLNKIARMLHLTTEIAVKYLLAPIQEIIGTRLEEQHSDKLEFLLLKLHEGEAFEESFFMKHFIIFGLKRSVEDANRRTQHILLRILMKRFIVSRLQMITDDLLIELLLVVAGIADRMRYDMMEFRPYENIADIVLLEDSLKTLLRLQIALKGHLLNEEMNYIALETEHLSPLTKVYISPLLPNSRKENSAMFASCLYASFLEGKHCEKRFPTFLLTYFYQCTTWEAEDLAMVPAFMPFITLTLFSSISMVTQLQHHLPCLQSMVHNYLGIVDRVLLPEVLGPNAVLDNRKSLAIRLQQLFEMLPKLRLQKFAGKLTDVVRKLHRCDATLGLANTLESLEVTYGNIP